MHQDMYKNECPSAVDWMNKLLYVHTFKYTAIIMYELHLGTAAQKTLKIMLRERSKAQKYVQYNSIYIKFKNFMRDKKIKKKKSAINIKKSRWCMEGKRRLAWGTHAGALALTEVVFFMS